MIYLLGFLLLYLITGDVAKAAYITALVWVLARAAGSYNAKGQVDSDGVYNDFGE